MMTYDEAVILYTNRVEPIRLKLLKILSDQTKPRAEREQASHDLDACFEVSGKYSTGEYIFAELIRLYDSGLTEIVKYGRSWMIADPDQKRVFRIRAKHKRFVELLK